MTAFPFVKGHGTQNDFVLLPDPDGTVHRTLDPSTVRQLANRYSGLGGDGVIRVVRAEAAPEAEDLVDDVEWYMDYRNADGSPAEMCGNGIRVMALYLWSEGYVHGPVLPIATRSGVRMVHAAPEGDITVEMGGARQLRTRMQAFVAVGDRRWSAVPVSMPNPHAVAFVDNIDEPGRLARAPQVRPESLFPEGANVEFVETRGPKHIALRVWERGVGETRSCGTGVCAAAWAAMRRDGVGRGLTYRVDVPGGTLRVSERPDGELLLTGPAELGVTGTVDVDRVT